jgi:hypothetical protein
VSGLGSMYEIVGLILGSNVKKKKWIMSGQLNTHVPILIVLGYENVCADKIQGAIENRV